MPPIPILFDDNKGRLAPLNDLRPAFDIRTGALTTLDRATCLFGPPAALFVPTTHSALTAQAHPNIPINTTPTSPSSGSFLLLNARCPVPNPDWSNLLLNHAILESQSSDLLVAHLPAASIPSALAGNTTGLTTTRLEGHHLLSRPWHIRTFRDPAINLDLDLLTRDARPRTIPGVTTLGNHPTSIHGSARISPTVVLDTEAGPIVLAADAVIRPGAIILGPAYIGEHSTILERTLIKPFTAIGPHCKIAGEVGGTIFQSHANKAHDGHLGDSWIGQWANLGAGTTNSNLLNTYDQVIARATPNGPNERTGQQFLGAVIGDHVKFAICSRIMTGSILHTGCMFAQTAAISGCIAPFTWATDAGTRTYRLDKFIEVAKAVMSRRKLTPTSAYLTRLTELHTQTSS